MRGVVGPVSVLLLLGMPVTGGILDAYAAGQVRWTVPLHRSRRR